MTERTTTRKTEPMAEPEIHALAERLAPTATACRDPSVERVTRGLLHLLVRGEPVPVARLAKLVDRTPDRVASVLRTLPDVEYDSAGRIVGRGITLRPTPHRFTVGGRTVFTWCAWDALAFPLLLDRTAEVVSSCPATRAAVRFVATPDGARDVDPSSAVVSLVSMTDCCASEGVRRAFCDHVHFFRSRPDAQEWLTAHPDGWVSSVDDAFALAAHVVATRGLAHTAGRQYNE